MAVMGHAIQTDAARGLTLLGAARRCLLDAATALARYPRVAVTRSARDLCVLRVGRRRLRLRLRLRLRRLLLRRRGGEAVAAARKARNSRAARTSWRLCRGRPRVSRWRAGEMARKCFFEQGAGEVFFSEKIGGGVKRS